MYSIKEGYKRQCLFHVKQKPPKHKVLGCFDIRFILCTMLVGEQVVYGNGEMTIDGKNKKGMAKYDQPQ